MPYHIIILKWILKVRWEGVEWIFLVQDKVKWWVVVNTIMKFWLHKLREISRLAGQQPVLKKVCSMS